MERLVLRVTLLHVRLLQILLDDLQTELRRRADADVLWDAREDLRQIIVLVVDHLLLALADRLDDALGNVRVDGRDERLTEFGPVDYAVAVKGLRALDDGGPLFRHLLEVGALNVPREIEVKVLVDITLAEQGWVGGADTHHAERHLLVAVLLVELPNLTERLGQRGEELINLKLVEDRVDGRIALVAGKAVVLLERRLKAVLGVVRVHVGNRTVGVMVFSRTTLGDERARAPAARRTALRMAQRRQHAKGGRVNAGVLVALDLVLPRLARLGKATAVVQLAAQILAAEQRERILAVRVAQQAALGIAHLVAVRRQDRVENGAVNARHAILVGQTLVGVHDTNLIRKPLLRVDERTADGLKVFGRRDGDELAANGLDGFLHPRLVPAVRMDHRTELFRAEVFHAVDAGHVLQIQRERRNEQVLVEVECTQHRIGTLGAVYRHGGFARVAQLLQHLARLAGRAVVLLLEDGFEVGRGVLVVNQRLNVNLRELLLEVLQTDIHQRFLAPLLPEGTHRRDALLVQVVGSQFNLAVHLGNLRVDEPAHEV